MCACVLMHGVYVDVCSLEHTEMPSAWQLMSHIRDACLPFLRCAAIFYHHLTGVVAPVSLHGK